MTNQAGGQAGRRRVRDASLRSIADCRRFLARVTNQLNRDEVTADKARALGYLVGQIKVMLEYTDIEMRIKKLEQALEEKTDG